MVVTNRVPHALPGISEWHEWAEMSNSSQTSWITRHNCTMVSRGGSRDLILQSVRSLADARPCTGQWVPWSGQCMDCIWSKEVLFEADWDRKGCVPLPNRALQHAAAYSGRGLDMVVGHVVLTAWNVYAWFVWIFGLYDVLGFRNSSCWWSPLIP